MADGQKDAKKKRVKLTAENVIEYIKQKRGNVASVARAMGWSRTHINRFIESHPTCQDALEEERETMKDNVESEFYRVCLDKDAPNHVTAMIFFLKTQARERGYTERYELSGVANEPIEFIIKQREDAKGN
jgi:hypothetical protein